MAYALQRAFSSAGIRREKLPGSTPSKRCGLNRRFLGSFFLQKDFDLYEICEEEPTSIKRSIESRDFSMDITVKTKHGGIITIEKMLDGKLEQ